MLLSQTLTENGEWYEARMGNLRMLHWKYYWNTFVKLYTQQDRTKVTLSNARENLYSQKLFLYEKKTQKAGKHHTDEIEAHRYQVADELKGKHIHIVDDFEQTHPHSPQHNHIHNIYSWGRKRYIKAEWKRVQWKRIETYGIIS